MKSSGPTLFDTLPEHLAPGAVEGVGTPPAEPVEAPEMPAGVLSDVATLRGEIREREVALMARAVAWADMHPAESIHQAACVPRGEGEPAIAGEGAPLVAEFCIAEFAAALGMSTDAGRHYLGAAVEIRYRLPKCQAQLDAGKVDAWRVRRVAESTRSLSTFGAAWVDGQVAPFLGKVGPAQLDRLIDEARRRFDPEVVIEATEGQRLDLHVTITPTVLVDGVGAVAEITGTLDLADALDLDTAIAQGAADLAAAGCPEPLEVRRALALGELARNQLAFQLTGAEGDEETPKSGRAKRQVELVIHLHQLATGGYEPFAQCDNTRTAIVLEQVRDWLAVEGTKITVRPVLDLNEHLEVPGYVPSERLKRQIELIHRTCAFPYCSRPAEACDCDHITAHADGGPTCSCNLAPLCRRHHRLKTHTAWTYETLDSGVHLWRSPHGMWFLRDPGGTTQITGPPARGPALN